MSQLVIPCPSCNSDLKRPNRKLLGRMAKCPKCTHKCRLEEPDEVQLTLANPPAPPPPPPESVPAVGTSARWVPDGDDAQPPVTEQTAVPANDPPTIPNVGDAFQFVDPTDTPVVKSKRATKKNNGGGSKSASKGSSRTGTRRKKKKKTWPLIAAAIGVLVLIAGAVIAIQSGGAPQSVNVNPEPAVNQQWQQQQTEMIAASDDLSALSPTSGEPISMLHVPAGTQLLINLRPAELWQTSNQFTEFRASLGPIASWIKDGILEFTGVEPAEIEQLTLYVVLGSRGSVPEPPP